MTPVIVDANIVFSAILRTNGMIADLLLNSKKEFYFIAPEFLRHEIKKHYGKISKVSGMTKKEILEAEFYVTDAIDFISAEQIDLAHLITSERLVSDIDPKDDIYIAYSLQFACKLWSGDRMLMKGLRKKGYGEFLTTDELFEFRESLRKITGKKE